MTSLTPNSYYLTDANYIEKKRRVIVEFRSREDKITKSCSFYPSLILSKDGSNKIVESILSLFDARRFRINRRKEAVIITAPTCHDLQTILPMLSSSLDCLPLLIKPERQFLIEKGWSYFDRFTIASDNFDRDSGISLPDAADFLPFPFKDTVEELIVQDKDSATGFMNKIALSNILTIKPNEVPDNKWRQSELFLEKLFFRHKFPLTNSKAGQENPSKNILTARKHSGVAELNFSNTWIALLAPTQFNLGYETINCDCCRPISIEMENVAPNSLINVLFLVDGIYFESNFKKWAGDFHRTMPEREQRLKQQKEWFLQSIPVGPFYRNQIATIPLIDTIRLLSEGKVSVNATGHSLIWFCKRKKPFLSKELIAINNRICCLEKLIEQEEKQNLKKHKIFYTENLSVNYFYRTAFRLKLMDLLDCLPDLILNPNSKFYLSPMADAIECLQSSVVDKFKQFSHEKGQKTIQSNRYNIYVKTDSALALAREFSDKYSLPLPEIFCPI